MLCRRTINRPNIRGFSLVESLAVLGMVSILAVVAAPSLRPIFDRQTLLRSTTLVRRALKEAQRQAMRDGSSCSVMFSATDIETRCPPTSPTATRIEQLPDEVSIPLNSTVTYTFRGTATGAGSIIQLDMDGLTSRCVEVVSIVGKLRTGVINSGNCVL
ncbi:type II secretion system protein [Synechococcus sp. PCC 7336]|uniref:pilus assembly FimT family protein n=1 Tax=Synechococcus sp. PCC 7336 TaxID=195250 RepID=UPI001D0D2C31